MKSPSEGDGGDDTDGVRGMSNAFWLTVAFGILLFSILATGGCASDRPVTFSCVVHDTAGIVTMLALPVGPLPMECLDV